MNNNSPAAGTAKNSPAAGTAKNSPAAGTAKNSPAAGTAKNSLAAGTAKNSPAAGTAKNSPTAGTAQKSTHALVGLALLVPGSALAQGFGAAVSTPPPAETVLISLAIALFLPWQIARLADRTPLVRSLVALGVALAAFACGAPPHVAGAAALIVMCLRAGRGLIAVLAGIAVVASVSAELAEACANIDVAVASLLLSALGFAPVVDAPAVFMSAGAVLVDPACAAVEATLIAFVMSLCLRSLAGERTSRVIGLGSLHAATLVGANVMRIVAVGIAMDSSATLADQVHTVGGLALMLVHLPFLAGPTRRLFKLWRSAVRTPSPSLRPAIASIQGAFGPSGESA